MEYQRVFIAVFAVLLAGLCVLPGLNAASIQCNSGGGTQISGDGYQNQIRTTPGCQSQTNENGSQTQSQWGSGSGTQSQTQCSGSACGKFTPLKPFMPFPQWNPFPQ